MIEDALKTIRERVEERAIKVGRNPADIRIVAVSKTKPPTLIREAYDCGQRAFGENYVQEMLSKIPHLPPDIEWHFIGHLQRNKVKFIIGKIKLLHSLDSLRLAEELEKRGSALGVKTDALIEINLSGEESKSGIPEHRWEALLNDLVCLKHVNIRGFMTMPPFFEDGELSRPYFKRLAEIRDRALSIFPSIGGELSMGMTQDYEVAVEEGATILRIGTAIFGKRD